MDLIDLAPLFACPTCGHAGSHVDEGRALACPGCGHAFPLCGKSVQTAVDAGLSDEWRQKQVEGEGRYRDERYNADDTLARLFGGFVAATVEKRGVILDVGCGIGETPPPYVAELGLESYLGLEPLAEATPRTYACLAGAVAEKIPLVTGAASAVLFATSLDHIEHVGPAYREVRRVLAPGGRLYFWVGLYEPELMAQRVTYRQMLMSGSLAKRAARLAFMHVYCARMLERMAVRKYKLWRNQRLDDKHFRYYTGASLAQELVEHGMTIERSLLVPGSNSYFVEARFQS